MRREDLDRLNVSYEGLDQDQREVRGMDALGVHTPAARAMFQGIAGDLSDTNFGIGWWAPQPDKFRRILISDQLLLCAQSVETNILEARLHLLELREARDNAAERMRRRVVVGPSGPRILPPERAADDLPVAMLSLHTGGFLRAIGSAFDCLAGVVIGVAAIPQSILHADFTRLMRYFGRRSANDAGEEAQAEIGRNLQSAIENAGPPGWHAWTLAYRNMLVHRGRHMQLSRLLPERSPILSATGQPLVAVKQVLLLPNDPGRSEIEVLKDAPTNHFLLTEDGGTTVERVYDSSVQVIEAASRELVELWRRRRASPSFLIQPYKQWEQIPATQSCGFRGYTPNTVEVVGETMFASPLFGRRLQAAALTDAQRDEWERP